MQFNVHAAKTNLSKLIDAALAGEEVVIARDNKPAVRLVPVEAAKKPFKMGMFAGKLGEGPDWFEPLPEDELRLWEGRDD